MISKSKQYCILDFVFQCSENLASRVMATMKASCIAVCRSVGTHCPRPTCVFQSVCLDLWIRCCY